MELKDLLSIETPTLDELEQTEALLQASIDEGSKKLAALNAEDRGLALDRMRGADTGAEARQAAIAKTQAERSDAAVVLAGVQAKIAAEKARQAAENEAAAYQATWEHLKRRREAMKKIDTLCDRIESLHDEMSEAYKAAIATTPQKPESLARLTPGHADIGKAIVTALNSRLGYPMRIESDALDRLLRINGMANYLNATEDRLMGEPVLNRDG